MSFLFLQVLVSHCVTSSCGISLLDHSISTLLSGNCAKHHCALSGNCEKYCCAISGNCTKYRYALSGNCAKYCCALSGNCAKHRCALSGNCTKYCCALLANCAKYCCAPSGNCAKHCCDLSGNCTKYCMLFSGNCTNQPSCVSLQTLQMMGQILNIRSWQRRKGFCFSFQKSYSSLVPISPNWLNWSWKEIRSIWIEFTKFEEDKISFNY